MLTEEGGFPISNREGHHYDLERAVDDGVNTYKAMYRDSCIVPGAAATEIELARRLKEFSFKETGGENACDAYA
ncbi:T-complex protein 1 subunit theta [Camellia lanceoleosa]|nr:T-complex protein 1 subunit theta [Camellia lanceoleosa]